MAQIPRTNAFPLGSERPAAGPPVVEIQALGHDYGSGPTSHRAIDRIDLTVHAGEIVSVVGPSGCGKTTLLRCICGLTVPRAGTIHLFGQLVREVPDGLAVVFQDYSRSLFPWMSVRRNVEFPLSRQGIDKLDRQRRSLESLEAVGLAWVGDRYPWQLSGGMQQRVAIARAIAYRPKVLLMDEPFASVDALTRGELEDLLLQLRNRYSFTVLFVTHDIDESVYIGDRVVVLSPAPARVVQVLVVDLPYPRDQVATRGLGGFVALRGEIARLVMRGPTDGKRPDLTALEAEARTEAEERREPG